MSATEPPLVEVKVANPVTYFRRWWTKVMSKEGVSLSFKIHPITAVLMVTAISLVAFSAGRYSINIPFLNYTILPTPTATPTPEPIWKQTAFTGKLQFSVTTNKYFLVTTSSEAITLDNESNLELLTLIGKRILAIGEYNKTARVLKITDAKDLEVLSKTPIPIPTIEPSPTPTTPPSETPLDSPSPSPLE